MRNRKQDKKAEHKELASYAALGLARFLRLESAEEVEVFKRSWPGYFPPLFWTWQIRQQPPGVVLSQQSVPQLPSVDFWRSYQGVLRESWRRKFPLEDAVRLLVAPVAQAVDALSTLPTCDFQRAVLLLALEPWRAKWCIQCGQPFAADKPASKFCSADCFNQARLTAKLKWWHENKPGHLREKQREGKHAKSARRTKR